MKIADVRTIPLSYRYDPPYGSAGGMQSVRGGLLVEIETDAGIIGIGEAGVGGGSARHVIEHQLRPMLVGQDPLLIEGLWQRMFARTRQFGRRGIVMNALSGIDIALWDIIGKACNKPIHKLIGGAHRTEVTAYATGLYFIDMNRLIEEAVEEAKEYVEQGFTAVKMKIGLGDPKLDLKRVAAVRDAIGPDVRLMVDANHCMTVPQAIRIGRELEKLDVEWFEEPISPEDVDGYVEVTRALDMAVAGGENEMTRWGFRDLVVRKAMDIVQPDVCAAGGISECRKIATLAAAHGVECVPHAWGSAIGLAATLHFLAALPDQPPSFRPIPPMLEFEQCENPFRDHLSREPIVQQRGKVKVPTGAGLGIEIDRSILDKYRAG